MDLFFLSFLICLPNFFLGLMTMVSGYTPDTISSIIDSLCSNLKRTHAWKSQWQFHMYTELYRLFTHWHSFFSFSKNVSKKWKFLIIICFELQTFAGFHFPTYIILIHKLHLRLWGFIAEGRYIHFWGDTNNAKKIHIYVQRYLKSPSFFSEKIQYYYLYTTCM